MYRSFDSFGSLDLVGFVDLCEQGAVRLALALNDVDQADCLELVQVVQI